MSCIKNKEAQKDVTILSFLLGDKDVARVIIDRNNGYPLSMDKDGNPSALYQELEENSNRKKALLAKSTLFNHNFIKEPTLKEFAETTKNPLVIDIYDNKLSKSGEPSTISEQIDRSIDDYVIKAETSVNSDSSNFSNYRKFKNQRIKILEEQRRHLINKKIDADNRNDVNAYDTYTEEIKYITNEIKLQEKHTNELGLSDDQLLENILKTAQEDLDIVRGMIMSGDKRMLSDGEDVLAWYAMLDNFESKADHPFYIQNVLGNGDRTIEKVDGTITTVKEEFTKISTEARALQQLTIDKMKAETYSELQNLKGYQKLVAEDEHNEITEDELFNGELRDIDTLSRWILNPNRTFANVRDSKGNELGDTPIGQLMTIHYATVMNSRRMKAQKMVNRIDNLLTLLGKKFKKEGFDMFLQTNEDGTKSPHLINIFTNEWFNFIDALEIEKRNELTELREQSLPGSYVDYNSAYSKYHKDLTKKADYIDIRKLSAIREFDKNENNGNNDDLFEIDTKYENELIQQLGAKQFNEMIASQKRLYNDYISDLNNYTFQLEVAYGNDTITEKQKTDRLNFFLSQYNPFLLHIATKDGKVKYKNTSTTITGKYMRVIPKKDSKYINQKFKDEIMNNSDENVYELWKAFEEALQYINGVLVQAEGNKIQFNTLLEMNNSVVKNMWSNKKFLKEEMLVNLQEWFSTKKTDKTKRDKNKINTASLKSLHVKVNRETRNLMMLLKPRLDITYAHKDRDNKKATVVVDDALYETIKNIASEQTFDRFIRNNPSGTVIKLSAVEAIIKTAVATGIQEQQDVNLPKMIKHYMLQAARVDAANKVMPEMNAMMEQFKNVKAENDVTRENAINRMNSYLNRTVKQFRNDKTALSFINFLTRKTNQEIEKLEYALSQTVKVKEIREIEKRIERLKEDTRTVDFLKPIQPFIIFMSMSYNFINGFRNRFQGTNSNAVRDQSGDFWKVGNDKKSARYMERMAIKKGINLAKRIANKKPGHSEKQIRLTRLFFAQVDLHQDMRDVSQKADRKLGREDWTKRISPYYLSITYPEYINQGQTILNVAQDYTIADKDGNVHQIFDGYGHPAHVEVNINGVPYGEIDPKTKEKSDGGILRLKDEFRYNSDGTENTENIENWEDFEIDFETGNQKGAELNAFHIAATDANIGVHGDYSDMGGIAAKDGVAAYLFTFGTWMGENMAGRLGSGLNLMAGTRRKKSIYGNITTPMGFIGAGTAAFFLGAIAGPAAGALIGAAIAIRMLSSRNPKSDMNLVKQSVNTIGLLGSVFINRHINRFRGADKADWIGTPNLGVAEEVARDMKAIATNMSYLLNAIALNLLQSAYFKCTNMDSDAECAAKKAKSTFVYNQIMMLTTDFLAPSNPIATIQFFISGPYLKKVLEILNFMYLTVNSDGRDTLISGDNKGRTRVGKAGARLMTPSVLKYAGMFENRGDYDNDFAKIIGEINGTPWFGQPTSSKERYNKTIIDRMFEVTGKSEAMLKYEEDHDAVRQEKEEWKQKMRNTTTWSEAEIKKQADLMFKYPETVKE